MSTRVRPHLWFEELHLRYAPGFPPPGFSLPRSELAPGINVVYGPNASGKTTLARALNTLLWPDQPILHRAALSARLHYQGEQWLVDFDAGRVTYQRNGAPGDPPALPPSEVRDRYNLALHDLLQEETANQDFAHAILRESSGGFDIAAAAARLDYHRPRRRSNRPTESRQLAQAKAHLNTVRQKQESLRDEERKLSHLEAQRREVAEARPQSEAYKLAVAFHQARHELEQAEEAFAAFPELIGRLSGHEAELLEHLRDQQMGAQKEKALAEEAVREARQRLEETRLPDEGVPSHEIQTLREELRILQEIEKDLSERIRESQGRQEQEAKLRQSLTGVGDPDPLPSVTAETVTEIVELARKAEEYRGLQAAEKKTAEWLGPPHAVSEPDHLQAGLRLLRAWLRESAVPEVLHRRGWALILVFAGLLTGACGILAWQLHWAWGAGSLIGLIALTFPWWIRLSTPSPQQLRQGDYLRLDLELPNEWSPADVEGLIDRLERRHAEAQLEQERARQWNELENRRRETDLAREQLESRKQELTERYSLDPETDEAWLCWFLQGLIRWQESDQECRRLEGEIAALRTRQRECVRRILPHLTPYGYAETSDSTALTAAVDDLEERRRQHSTALSELTRARQHADHLQQRMDRQSRELAELFEGLGLDRQDEDRIVDGCRRLPDYRRACERLRLAQERCRHAEEALQSHPHYESAMKRQTIETLEEQWGEAQRKAETYQTLSEEIAKIRERIESAKHGYDLEQALAEYEAAADALTTRRDGDYASAAGALLSDFLHRETRERERPAVFHRARELFIEITRGHYRIELEDAQPPVFRAVDTRSGLSHGLSELSSGTRVQLLLAVRMAFVEFQEKGLALPLFLDETLANSDDQRAQAMIDAACSIARQGRQVFYFTAQADEVGKWQAALKEEPEGLCHFIDLSRQQARVDHQLPAEPMPIKSVCAEQVPTPAERSHEEYGRLLEVPPIRAWHGSGPTHLWYVIEDPPQLYHLLQLGIETCGQLQAFLRHGGAPLFSHPQQVPSIEAGIQVVDQACRYWRIGRPHPIDRQVLIDSGAVSENFLEEVTRLAESVHGDPGPLLEALENKEVKRFPKKAIERLRLYLTENGYLPQAEPLAADDLRMRVLAAVSEEIREGLLSPEGVDRILARLAIRTG